MRARLGPAVVLTLATFLPVRGFASAKTLDDPGDLMRVYAAIVAKYQEGSDAAALELLALGAERGRTLHERIAQATRQPAVLPRDPWTPALLRAAAMMHSDIAFRAHAIGDQATFTRHVSAADRLLQVADRHEPSSAFRPRWHVAAGLALLDGAEVESARAFLTGSCERFPERAEVRLACGIALTTYASVLKTTPPAGVQVHVEGGQPWGDDAEERRRVSARNALLEVADLHFAAAIEADAALDEARLRLANAHVGRGRDQRAEPLLAPLAAANRTGDIAYLARLMLGRIRENQGRHEDAATLYRSASALKPDAPRAKIALAQLLHALGDREAAREIVDDVVMMRLNPPDDPWTRYPIAFIATPFSSLADLRREVRK